MFHIHKRYVMLVLVDRLIIADISKGFIASSLQCPYQFTVQYHSARNDIPEHFNLLKSPRAVSVSADVAGCTLLFVIPLVCLV